MKKWLTIVITVCAVMFITACSDSDTHSYQEAPAINENVTLEQSLKDNWEWSDFEPDDVDYALFPAYDRDKKTGYNYVVVYPKKAVDGVMPVAVGYYEDSSEDIFSCHGKMLMDAEGGLEDGGSRIFGSYPIGEDGTYLDICVGYSSTGYFSVNDVETSCEKNGIIICLAEHGFEMQFGNRQPKE